MSNNRSLHIRKRNFDLRIRYVLYLHYLSIYEVFKNEIHNKIRLLNNHYILYWN